jgi:hypothetical protein
MAAHQSDFQIPVPFRPKSNSKACYAFRGYPVKEKRNPPEFIFASGPIV